MRILLIEDNEMNWDMLSRRLRRKGHEVTVATDGAQGLARAQELLPDIILLDLSLPVIDGWEVARRLRASPQTRDIPVVALTAHAMADDERRAREAGCDDYETKPVNLRSLLATIARHSPSEAA